MNRINGQVIKQEKLDLQKVPKQYRDIAKGMEQQFVQFMVEQMNKTAPSQEPESSAVKFYKSLLNERHSEIMTNQDEGLGIQRLILEQIVPDHLKERMKVTSNPQKNYQAMNKASDRGIIKPGVTRE